MASVITASLFKCAVRIRIVVVGGAFEVLMWHVSAWPVLDGGTLDLLLWPIPLWPVSFSCSVCTALAHSVFSVPALASIEVLVRFFL